jgi:hypothetical protein
MSDSEIQVLELRRLLYELKDQRPDICIRFRLIGEMWQSSFSKVDKLTESGVILTSEATGLCVEIKDLREIVQFEIDGKYQNYLPHYHYNVTPTMNISERHFRSGS